MTTATVSRPSPGTVFAASPSAVASRPEMHFRLNFGVFKETRLRLARVSGFIGAAITVALNDSAVIFQHHVYLLFIEGAFERIDRMSAHFGVEICHFEMILVWEKLISTS